MWIRASPGVGSILCSDGGQASEGSSALGPPGDIPHCSPALELLMAFG